MWIEKLTRRWTDITLNSTSDIHMEKVPSDPTHKPQWFGKGGWDITYIQSFYFSLTVLNITE